MKIKLYDVSQWSQAEEIERLLSILKPEQIVAITSSCKAASGPFITIVWKE